MCPTANVWDDITQVTQVEVIGVAIPAEDYETVRADLIAGLRRYDDGRQVDTLEDYQIRRQAGPDELWGRKSWADQLQRLPGILCGPGSSTCSSSSTCSVHCCEAEAT